MQEPWVNAYWMHLPFINMLEFTYRLNSVLCTIHSSVHLLLDICSITNN